jgi:nucleoside 2-deoxyribosyltransferase
MSHLKLPEQIYFAAPFETDAQRAFNQRIVRLMRNYNFPTFFPQEHWEEGMEPETFHAVCLEALSQSHLVLAVSYGDVFDAQTAFEIGYAQGRRHTVICLRNNLGIENVLKDKNGNGTQPVPDLIQKSCVRFISACEKDEDLLNPLISILNRYYGSYTTSLLS